jgi:two-component system sensor histidine kinase KdpD
MSRESNLAALYELTRELAEAGTRDEVVWQVLKHINRVFHGTAAFVLPFNGALAPHADSTLVIPEPDLALARYVFTEGKPAGRSTDNSPEATTLQLPLATERNVMGVLAVSLPAEQLSQARRELLEAFARQTSLVLDRVELRAAAENARLIAESERLSRVLLNSISHELRTPLAASTSAASTLLASQHLAPESQRALLREIQEANERLNRIVGNLLDMARLESGKVVPRLDWYDVRDLVQTTVLESGRDCSTHKVLLELPPEPMLARCDFSLMQHALGNLIGNAAVHTPAGTEIVVSARSETGAVLLSVADHGPGLTPELLEHIFEKFYRGPAAPPGGSGLGLTIARGFIEAHGGSITATNRPGGGAVFCLRLPQSTPPPAVAS